MLHSKTLVFVQSLLLLSRCVLGQAPTPNVTLYFPGAATASFDTGEFLEASEISLAGSTTVLEVVDNDPSMSATATFTLELSPSGAELHAVLVEPVGEEDFDETCTFSGGDSICNLNIVAKVFNGPTTVTTSGSTQFTEPIAGVPMIALNFQVTPTSTPAPAPTSPPDSKSPGTSSAVSPQVSIALISIVAFGLVFQLL